jgi:hypothetical protein
MGRYARKTTGCKISKPILSNHFKFQTRIIKLVVIGQNKIIKIGISRWIWPAKYISCSLRPKPGFGIGKQNQGPV